MVRSKPANAHSNSVEVAITCFKSAAAMEEGNAIANVGGNCNTGRQLWLRAVFLAVLHFNDGVDIASGSKVALNAHLQRVAGRN